MLASSFGASLLTLAAEPPHRSNKLTPSLPLTRPLGQLVYVAASQLAPFSSPEKPFDFGALVIRSQMLFAKESLSIALALQNVDVEEFCHF